MAKTGQKGTQATSMKSTQGRQFGDYIRFLQYSGRSNGQTPRLRREDADWDPEQLAIEANAGIKDHETSRVDFNPGLKAHLKGPHLH